jgi:putative transcriptional regulator
MKMSELSKQTGISKNALSDLYYEKTDRVRFETLNKLCQALHCSLCELLEYMPDEASNTQEAAQTDSTD